jgi:IPT/TIG domain
MGMVRYPLPITKAMTDRAYLPVYTWNGGVFGDDVYLAKTNTLVDDQGRGDYTPRNQDDKAKLPGASPPNVIAGEPDFVMAVDVARPRGAIDPSEPYPDISSPAEPAPTITSLSPNTAVAGSPGPLAVIITGTNFTQWSKVVAGGAEVLSAKYVSPTKMTILMNPQVSVPGVITVYVWDHNVASATSNFTYT